MRITAVSATFNSRDTIWRSLSSLAAQDVPVTLMLFDSGSKDGTEWWITTARFRSDLGNLGLHTLRLLPPIPDKVLFEGRARKNKAIEHQLAKVAWECSQNPPDAILWLQPDVTMPNGGLQKMVDAMEDDSHLGGVGIKHRAEVDHVRMGCALYRWEPFAKLAELGFFSQGCPCRWIHQTMEKDGWTLRNLDDVEGTHIEEGASECQ